MDDAKSATSLIADDLDTYQDDSLVETLLGGLQEFLDSPARVRQLLSQAPAALLCHCWLRAVPLFHSRGTESVLIASQRTLLAESCQRLVSERLAIC